MKKSNITLEIMKALVGMAIESVQEDKEQTMSNERINEIEGLMKKENPTKFIASKMVFSAIINEYHVIVEHEDENVRKDWFNLFIDFHNEWIDELKKKDYVSVVENLNNEYGEDFFNGLENKTLYSLAEESKELYTKSLKKKYEIDEQKNDDVDSIENELSVKLEEVASLSKKLLEKQGLSSVAGIEARINGVEISIKTNEKDTDDCICGMCGKEDEKLSIGEMFEKLIRNHM